jgi:hypothetical protein
MNRAKESGAKIKLSGNVASHRKYSKNRMTMSSDLKSGKLERCLRSFRPHLRKMIFAFFKVISDFGQDEKVESFSTKLKRFVR